MLYNTENRPKLLTWLSIGSFVAGVSWIAMLVTFIIIKLTGNVSTRLFPGLVTEYFKAGNLFIIIELFLSFIGITGVLMMWQMKNTGFYIYTVAKSVLYFLPAFVIGFQHLTFPGLLLTSVMIIGYGTVFTKLKERKT